ncbi:dTDP-4-dehydrorhamnose 3,5-epimerase [Nonomuraea sp. NPDC005983]|uniref:dTDP-4-dehydrorhamnose 3,5-epimerase family protein n=1 Tax=Nonomuraea sp. NPDC005983 TaxID=3155595 RepID=UPI0033B1320E
MKALGVEDAWTFTPRVHADSRGSFLEAFRAADLPRAFDLAQVNCSVSRRGVLRGLHFADVPPGQAKYLMCVSGSILDVVVDLRVGSPGFGRVATAVLDDQSRRAMYVAEGLGHAFLTLSEQATVVYLCSQGYNPAAEHGIDPLDPALGIDWPLTGPPLLSGKDAAAPTLAEALEAGLLPSYDRCREFYAGLH